MVRGMSPVPWFFCALLTVPILLSGCGQRADRKPVLEDYNVLLIVIDTLGANNVGCYNPELSLTPHIDRLAEQGVRFAKSYAVAPWTQPSVASILTGLMPSKHGLNQLGAELDGKAAILAELLKDRGYETGAVVSHRLVNASFGFGRGYGYFDEEPIGGHKKISSQMVTDSALQWLDGVGTNRFHLLLHYFDPHYVYCHHEQFDMTSGYEGPLEPAMNIWSLRNQRERLTEEDISYLVGLHREEIAYTDHHIGRLLEHLETLGVADKTLIVLTADHGEEFMEHGWLGHTRSLYNELIHVPVIFYLPGVFGEGIVSEMPVSQIDVLPTLMDFSKRPVSEAWDGRSLLPILLGDKPGETDRDIFAEVSFVPRSKKDVADEKITFLTTLVRGNLKAIYDEVDERWEVYDLAKDPGESNILALEGRAQVLADDLSAWKSARVTQPDQESGFQLIMTSDEEESLRSLGYIR